MEGVLDEFLRDLREGRGAAGGTLRGYACDLGQWAAFLSGEAGVGSWAEVKPAQVRRFLARLHEREYARTTIARKLSALRALFRYLGARGEVSSDPTVGVRAPRVRERLPQFLYQGEVEKLLAAPDARTPLGVRDRALLETLYATGLRVGELVSLMVAQCEGASELRVVGKGGRERVVMLGRPAQDAIERYLAEGRPHLVGEAVR